MMEHLQTGRAFGLSILAGLIAGVILAGINVVLVQPYVLALADIELDNLLAEGEFDEEGYDAQIQSIYISQIYVPVIIGLAGGALVGGALAFSKITIDPVKAALLMAGIAWFVLYVVPAVKYPPSPSAMFGSEQAATYQALFAGYTAVSGLAALGIAFGFRKIKRKEKALGAAALYLVVVAGAFFAFPDLHDEEDSFVPQPLLSGWRSAISLSMTVFWFVLGAIAGLMLKHQSKSSVKH